MSGSKKKEVPDANPTPAEIRVIFETNKNVAVVGLSDDPDRYSYRVAAYLKEQGYRIIPVNPTVSEVLGETAYPDLKSVPELVDIVDIFRKKEAIAETVDDAIEIGAKVVWMQLDLVENNAARKARDAGLQVVQSKCMKQEHERLQRA